MKGDLLNFDIKWHQNQTEHTTVISVSGMKARAKNVWFLRGNFFLKSCCFDYIHILRTKEQTW